MLPQRASAPSLCRRAADTPSVHERAMPPLLLRLALMLMRHYEMIR